MDERGSGEERRLCHFHAQQLLALLNRMKIDVRSQQNLAKDAGVDVGYQAIL